VVHSVYRSFMRAAWANSRPLLAAAVFGTFAVGCAVSSAGNHGTFLTQSLTQQLSPKEHEKIADQYVREAEQAREMATTHRKRSTEYAAWPPGNSEMAKRGATLAEHCRHLSEDYIDAAQTYEAMAAEHRALARLLRNRSDD